MTLNSIISDAIFYCNFYDSIFLKLKFCYTFLILRIILIALSCFLLYKKDSTIIKRWGYENSRSRFSFLDHFHTHDYGLLIWTISLQIK